MTAVQINKAVMIAKAVVDGSPLRTACARFRLQDKTVRKWLAEIGLDPRIGATLRTKDLVEAARAWLNRNAGGVS